MVLGGFGSFWVVLGSFGWFWVVPCFSNYQVQVPARQGIWRVVDDRFRLELKQRPKLVDNHLKRHEI